MGKKGTVGTNEAAGTVETVETVAGRACGTVETVKFTSVDGVERQFGVEHASRLVMADKGRTWILTDKNWIVSNGKLIRNAKKSE
jgi:hypothetical protein